LATVVIGGIFTNTLLTLLVLPALYTLFQGRQAAFGNHRPPAPGGRAVPAD
jgi:hypothetical protein